jgi:hypothetical protein
MKVDDDYVMKFVSKDDVISFVHIVELLPARTKKNPCVFEVKKYH